jgi:hypothetical protein
VQQDQWRLAVFLTRPPLEGAQLVDDGVPVVISVDQRQVDSRELAEHVEALEAVKAQPLSVFGEQPVDVQRWVRVDRVHDRVVLLCPAQQRSGNRTDLDADLDDHARTDRFEQGLDEKLQEPVHGGLDRKPRIVCDVAPMAGFTTCSQGHEWVR